MLEVEYLDDGEEFGLYAFGEILESENEVFLILLNRLFTFH